MSFGLSLAFELGAWDGLEIGDRNAAGAGHKALKSIGLALGINLDQGMGMGLGWACGRSCV